MEKESPIAVFDSGVGSYSIVRVLQTRLPRENIVYLADRASFPYGGKSHEELLSIIRKTISWLERNYSPKLIVVASNTPSIQVLADLKHDVTTSLIGVFPPIEEAVKHSRTKHIAILATKGAVRSSELDGFIREQKIPSGAVIHKVDASALVALVEPGTFQTNAEKTKKTIEDVIGPVLKADPLVDAMTLSSTHLPFLRKYLEELYPIAFLDPADEAAKEVESELSAKGLLSEGKGSIEVVATVQGDLTGGDLQSILKTLGLQTRVRTVAIG